MLSRKLARWSPERFHLALSRLMALVWIRWKWNERNELAPGSASFSFDREQMAIEAYSVSITWVTFMAGSLTCLTSHSANPALAALNFMIQLLVLLVVTPLLMAVVSITLRLSRFTGRDAASTSRIQSFVFFLVAGMTAGVLILEHRCRLLGIIWLTLNGLNALAALILWTFRRQVRALEEFLRQCPPEN